MLHTALLLAVVAVAQSEIETKYDKFDDETRYYFQLGRQFNGDEYRSLSLHADQKGEQRRRFSDSETITLLVYRSGRGWLYLNDHDVVVMEGRNRFVIRTDYDSKIDEKDHKCNEYVHIEMHISEAKKRMESGKDWEIKIGVEEPFPIGPVTRKKIKEFLDFIQDAKLEDKKKEDPPKKKGFE